VFWRLSKGYRKWPFWYRLVPIFDTRDFGRPPILGRFVPKNREKSAPKFYNINTFLKAPRNRKSRIFLKKYHFSAEINEFQLKNTIFQLKSMNFSWKWDLQLKYTFLKVFEKVRIFAKVKNGTFCETGLIIKRKKSCFGGLQKSSILGTFGGHYLVPIWKWPPVGGHPNPSFSKVPFWVPIGTVFGTHDFGRRPLSIRFAPEKSGNFGTKILQHKYLSKSA
jgi:hypothetical protein